MSAENIDSLPSDESLEPVVAKELFEAVDESGAESRLTDLDVDTDAAELNDEDCDNGADVQLSEGTDSVAEELIITNLYNDNESVDEVHVEDIETDCISEEDSPALDTADDEKGTAESSDTDDETEESDADAIVYDGEESEDEESEDDTTDKDEEKSQKKKIRAVGSRRIDSAFDFVELFIFTLVGVLLITSFFFRHSIVSGGSMLGTLHDNDKLIVSDFLYTPEYKDIIVVEDRSAGILAPIVKRVIATEGQLVRVAYKGIYVDGKLLDEDYVFTDYTPYYYMEVFSYPTAFADNDTLVFERGEYYEFVVPEDEVFVLGDHRNDSSDSRKYGTLREDAIIGRVLFRFYPFNKDGGLFTFFLD